MTVDAGAVPDFDARAVCDWIAGLGIGARPPLTLTRIGHGQSNLTFLVTDDDESAWVLRRPPFGELLASAHDVAREHLILGALADTEVPTPRPFALCEDPAVSPVPLLLMEHVDGLVIDEMAIAEGLSAERRGAISESAVAALAGVHAVDLESAGLATLASRKPYAERQLRRWRGQWERVRRRDLPLVEELADRLEAAMPEAEERTLIHGDFNLRNLVVSAEEGSVRAILDWELSTLGDPLADLGGLLAYWPQQDDSAKAVFQASSLPGFLSREELAGVYAERTGRSLETLGFWHVLGLWKIAIIGEGVLHRARESSDNAVPAGSSAAVDALLSHTQAVAAAEGI